MQRDYTTVSEFLDFLKDQPDKSILIDICVESANYYKVVFGDCTSGYQDGQNEVRVDDVKSPEWNAVVFADKPSSTVKAAFEALFDLKEAGHGDSIVTRLGRLFRLEQKVVIPLQTNNLLYSATHINPKTKWISVLAEANKYLDELQDKYVDLGLSLISGDIANIAVATLYKKLEEAKAVIPDDDGAILIRVIDEKAKWMTRKQIEKDWKNPSRFLDNMLATPSPSLRSGISLAVQMRVQVSIPIDNPLDYVLFSQGLDEWCKQRYHLTKP